jgi:3-oxoacyl-[acyl-carrier-protein] synthase II
VKRVVVTGIGAITALGKDAKSSFDAIIAGECAINTITSFDPENFAVKIAAEIKDFDASTVMEAKEVKKADRFIHLGMKVAQDAIKDANLPEDMDMDRFGVSAASGIGGLPNIGKNAVICENRGPRRISPFFIPSSLVNMLGGFISIEHKIKGPNISSVTACAAGTHGIGECYKTIALGGADAMLAVSAESAICEVGIGGFAAMKALSTRNDEPQKASRPFDAERNGFIMGEGAAALVIEEYESAKARGAKIYAEIVGIGESGDANHITSPVVDGPLRAMKAAMNMAGNPTVDYISAHGTSTPANDKNESAAVKALFGEAKECPPMSSIKGAIGHCLGAAGGIEAVMSILSMQEGKLLPTINYETPDLENGLDLDYVPNRTREAEINTIMSNSFGFGGTNGVVIMKKI